MKGKEKSMKTYKSGDLTHKRAEVMKEAATNGVIIQELRTNGEVRQEFVITTTKVYETLKDILMKTGGDL